MLLPSAYHRCGNRPALPARPLHSATPAVGHRNFMRGKHKFSGSSRKQRNTNATGQAKIACLDSNRDGKRRLRGDFRKRISLSSNACQRHIKFPLGQLQNTLIWLLHDTTKPQKCQGKNRRYILWKAQNRLKIARSQFVNNSKAVTVFSHNLITRTQETDLFLNLLFLFWAVFFSSVCFFTIISQLFTFHSRFVYFFHSTEPSFLPSQA